MDFFNGIPKIKYEGKDSKKPLAFKFYDENAKIFGKTQREYLKFAMSYWHTMCAGGTDMFGEATLDKTYSKTNPIENAKEKAYAAFELMDKLGIDYYCFHDRDIAPEGETIAESNKNLDEISDLLLKLQKDYDKKVLWGTANLFNNRRYMHGAGTSPNADVFAFAAAQIKKAIDITTKLNGGAYLFWGGREGYETLLNTDISLELDNMARLLTMARDYGRSIGFKGDFFIEPKPKEPTKHQYDFDASTVLAFLRKYDLTDDFKLNIEANHATLAGHTFQHELRVCRDNGVFGSIDANSGDTLLGWDTDQFPTNIYDTTLCMYEVIKAGGFKTGGLNFDAKARRGSNTKEDIFLSYIAGMDAFALGLLSAEKIIKDGRLDSFVKDRYKSYDIGIGKKIKDGTTDLRELEEYALKIGEVKTNESGKQEYLESVINSLIF